MNTTKIAWLGLGIMGSGMARRLLAGGFSVTVFNRNPEKSAPFAAEGSLVAASPRAAASGAEIIISMVADDNASRSLWLGPDGALTAAAPGTLCLECSTLTVGWVLELAAAVAAKKCEFLDAPVTGSKTHAANGELNFLVGGAEANLAKARPALAAMGKAIWPLGPIGSGALLKLINNFMCGVQVAALAEAMTMIERSGLDRAKSLEFLCQAAPGSPVVKMVTPRMTAPDFTPNFPLRLMTKDLNYAMLEGGKLSVEMETAAAARKIFQNAIAAGLGDNDMAAIIETFRQK